VKGLAGAAWASTIVLCASSAEAQWQPPPPPPSGGMLSGLTPAPPPPPTPAQIRTVQELDQAKRDDAGRRLEWVWSDVQGGFEQLGMQTLNGGARSFVAGFVDTSSSGGCVSVGAGARLLFFTFLLRGRLGVFDSGLLYRIGGEAGLHIPLGNVEPHLALGLGYAAMGGLHDTVGGAAAQAIAIRGFYTRVTAGLDYYVTPIFSVGADLSTELLGLTRPALTAAEVQNVKDSPGVGASFKSNADLLAGAGTGWGGTVAVVGALGLHF
jgi:hypothetical protein